MGERLKAYNRVSKYLNEKGAPSNIWGDLEKVLEPNGIFLKQREEIRILKRKLDITTTALCRIRQCDKEPACSDCMSIAYDAIAGLSGVK